jgi:hypothetical protein
MFRFRIACLLSPWRTCACSRARSTRTGHRTRTRTCARHQGSAVGEIGPWCPVRKQAPLARPHVLVAGAFVGSCKIAEPCEVRGRVADNPDCQATRLLHRRLARVEVTGEVIDRMIGRSSGRWADAPTQEARLSEPPRMTCTTTEPGAPPPRRQRKSSPAVGYPSENPPVAPPPLRYSSPSSLPQTCSRKPASPTLRGLRGLRRFAG